MNASFYVGIDWGNYKHALCVIDAEGHIQKERLVDTDFTVLDVLDEVLGDVDRDTVHVAIEDKGNVLVDTLVARRYRIHTINPKQVDRFRERESVAGAKDDRRDARVLAMTLRTDGERFTRVAALPEQHVRLQGHNAAIDDLDVELRRLGNQLRAMLLRYFPALLSLCEGADEPWFWDLVLELRTVEHAKSVQNRALTKLLARHRKRKLTVDDLRAVIDKKHLEAAAGVDSACLPRARNIIAALKLLHEQRVAAIATRRALLDELKGAADAPTDVDILLSVPGIGEKAASVLVVEAGRLLIDGDPSRLRAIAGVAHVTKRSGRSHAVSMRRACNDRLRQTMHHVAAHAARLIERFRNQYARLRRAGHTHARALRSVADSLLSILTVMLRSRTLFRSEEALQN